MYPRPTRPSPRTIFGIHFHNSVTSILRHRCSTDFCMCVGFGGLGGRDDSTQGIVGGAFDVVDVGAWTTVALVGPIDSTLVVDIVVDASVAGADATAGEGVITGTADRSAS